jgi:hypothetical protein
LEHIRDIDRYGISSENTGDIEKIRRVSSEKAMVSHRSMLCPNMPAQMVWSRGILIGQLRINREAIRRL